MAALGGAYNYSDPVLFKSTLATVPYTFRPTKQGALSYFIGNDCLLKLGTDEDQFPPAELMAQTLGNGFALANYGPRYSGFSGCTLAGDSVTGESVGRLWRKVRSSLIV